MWRAIAFCVVKRFEDVVQSLRGIYLLVTRFFLRTPFPRTPHTKTHIQVCCDWWWRPVLSDNLSSLCSNAIGRCFVFYEILSWSPSFSCQKLPFNKHQVHRKKASVHIRFVHDSWAYIEGVDFDTISSWNNWRAQVYRLQRHSKAPRPKERGILAYSRKYHNAYY